MPDILVTVAIPTLAADSRLEECLASLAAQTLRAFEVVVVDNSGCGKARSAADAAGVRHIENRSNLGFGAAINQAFLASSAPFLALLNDDAVASPLWLQTMVEAMRRRPDVGACASSVHLFGEAALDSAGMLVAADASSKQRGHGCLPADFPVEEEILFPSGSAALLRRTMLEETGLFDESFFLYCEDTDLGLRARWAGWKCLYVPSAVVQHHYSHSAGRVSGLKAYYVERNRLFVALKTFPARRLLAVPFASVIRYGWHLWYMLNKRGAAARFSAEGNSGPLLAWYVLKAHLAVAANAPRLLRQRRLIMEKARITPAVFCFLMDSNSIPLRSVAAL